MAGDKLLMEFAAVEAILVERARQSMPRAEVADAAP
jgi:hypothetical protein